MAGESAGKAAGMGQRSIGLPVLLYNLNDALQSIVSDWRFIDAVIITIAFLSVLVGLPYYPWLIGIVLIVLLFIASMKHPFLGLIILAALTFPPLMYQSPGIAWVYAFVFTAAMILGYMHYRSLIIGYTLIALSFSALGRVLFIPFLILTPLILGFKRSAIVVVVVFLSIIALTSSMGIQNNSYILYSTTKSLGRLGATGIGSSLNYTLVRGTRPTLSLLGGATSNAAKVFLSQKLLGNISNIFILLGYGILQQPLYIAEMLLVVGLTFLIEYIGVSERSKYRAVKASLAGIVYPVFFVGVSTSSLIRGTGEIALLSFLIAPIGIYILELYNFDVFKALEVKKRDIRMKFGEAFEDLQVEGTNETFDDIAGYDDVKKEMMRSIIGPIEEKGVSRKYGIKPVKGVLLFGPPGNGKTMMMRALANEIHFGFYRIAAPNLISAFSGESEKKLAEVFTVAKKNSPCILFIDEIDAIGTTRDMGDEVHKHVLTQLLEELDGFQKLDRVIVVGATNKPNLLDPALLRSGRFDRSIYVPLPDKSTRMKIFKMYLSKLPVTKDIDIEKLADLSERFSAADIRNLCEATSQTVAREAVEKHTLLKVTNADIVRAIKSTKPSTRLVQIDEYTKFKNDFERLHNVMAESETTKVSMDMIVGYEDFKKTVTDSIEVLARPELAKSYDVKGTNGILIYGPPGTGKTMMMRNISKSVEGVTMIELDSVEVLGAGVEDAPGIIKEYFYRANENKPAILFIDEIDGFVGSRKEVGKDISREIISEFLKQMDGMRGMSGVMVVATTNNPDALDPALLRPGRFDKLIYVGLPKRPTRKLMFIRFLRDAPIDSINFDKLADMSGGYTGAEIYAACNSAKKKALRGRMHGEQNQNVTQQMVEDSIKAIKPATTDEELKEYSDFGKKYYRAE